MRYRLYKNINIYNKIKIFRIKKQITMDFNLEEFNIDKIDDNKRSNILPSIPKLSPTPPPIGGNNIESLDDLDLIINKNKTKTTPTNNKPPFIKSVSPVKSININNSAPVTPQKTPTNKLPGNLFSSMNSKDSDLNDIFNSNNSTKPKTTPIIDLDKELKDTTANLTNNLNSLNNMRGPKPPNFTPTKTPFNIESLASTTSNNNSTSNNNNSAFNNNNEYVNITNLSYEEMQLQKMKLLSKIERLKNNSKFKKMGLRFIKDYNMNSDYDEMKTEYDIAFNNYQLHQSIHFQRHMFITFASGLEIASKSSYNPFDLDFEGLGDAITDEADTYNDIFEELHLKYIGEGGTYPPELRLIFKFGITATMCLLQKKIVSNSDVPEQLEDLLQDPKFKQDFREAMVRKMQEKNKGKLGEGLSNFMATNTNAPPIYNANKVKDASLDDILNKL